MCLCLFILLFLFVRDEIRVIYLNKFDHLASTTELLYYYYDNGIVDEDDMAMEVQTNSAVTELEVQTIIHSVTKFYDAREN